MPAQLKKEDLIRFNKELLAIVKSGVPIERSLAQMAKELSGTLRDFAVELEQRTAAGKPLSEALEAHRPQLSEYYVAMVRTGEETGNLATVLEAVVVDYQKSHDFERTIKSAVRYPLVILSLAFIIFLSIVRIAMPRIEYIYGTINATLPAITVAVIRIGHFIFANLVLILVCIVALIIVVRLWTLTTGGKRFWDAFLLSLPFVGKVIYFDFVSRFARNVSQLLRYNVPVDRALALARSTLWHSYGLEVARNLEANVRKGVPLSAALERERCFPETMVWMIKFAEERGDLENALRDVADYYDDRYFELRTEVAQFFEPAMILLVGALVGFLVIVFYLPMFDLPRLIH
jgi:type II secretory pathway component PulF